MLSRIRNWIRKYSYSYYTIGFIQGGLDSVMNKNKEIKADFIKWTNIDNKGSWFADPFVLDVNDSEISLLVEEMPKHIHKGIITKLVIDRISMEVKRKSVVLDLEHHLSFPDIFRRNGKIYIYPESSATGELCEYEYDDKKEIAEFKRVVCDDVIWDSVVTDLFDDNLLFTAAHDDFVLDIYKWNSKEQRYKPYQEVKSQKRNSRMGGAIFEYYGSFYYPAQKCDLFYGHALEIKKLCIEDSLFSSMSYRVLKSPHKTLKLGMHTMNEYKGVVVIDVLGFEYKIIGSALFWMKWLILRVLGKRI